MKEAEWVELVAKHLRPVLLSRRKNLEVRTGLRLAYGHEIRQYSGTEASVQTTSFQTDLSVIELARDGSWRPRVIVEAKMGSVTTHDAITYSQKAEAHRTVHPYLRYGIMLGDRGDFALPGRLFRHGTHFDFMFSFRRNVPSHEELGLFVKLLAQEVAASVALEAILYDSRKKERERYAVFHRKLELKKPVA